MPRYIKNIEQLRAKSAYQFVEGTKEFKSVEGIDSSFFQAFLKKKLIPKNSNNSQNMELEIDAFLSADTSTRETLVTLIPFSKYLKVISDYAGDYKSYVKKIPMMIKNNGLSNTFAFVLSKSKDGNAYTLIDEQMREWFKDKITTETSFVQYLIKLDSVEYRRMTVEVFAFFTWLKRFADGLIETDEDNAQQPKEEEVTDGSE